jgi:hypothetical protein
MKHDGKAEGYKGQNDGFQHKLPISACPVEPMTFSDQPVSAWRNGLSTGSCSLSRQQEGSAVPLLKIYKYISGHWPLNDF